MPERADRSWEIGLFQPIADGLILAVKEPVLPGQNEAPCVVEQEFAAAVRGLGSDLRRWPEEARGRALAMLVHACDIGNPAKPLALSLQWSERIVAENLAQVRGALSAP